MMMWGTTSPSAKLTDDSGSAFEAPLVGDCRLFRSLATNQPPRLLGLLQQYRHKTDLPRCPQFGRYRGESGHGGYERRLPSWTHFGHGPTSPSSGVRRRASVLADAGE